MVSASTITSMLPALDLVSSAAFAGPPWHRAPGHREHLERITSVPGAALFVVAESGSVVGFAIGTVLSADALAIYGLPSAAAAKAGHYHLTWRAVLPAKRGLGVGTELVRVRVADALDRGCRAIHAVTDQRNYGTRHLLKSLDFVEVSHQPTLRHGRVGGAMHYRRVVV